MSQSQTQQRLFVVGDVHGCLFELQALLKKAGFAPGDQLVLVGDLVAKGPDSQGVIECVRGLGGLAVLGNHDARVLEALQGNKVKRHHEEVAKTMTEPDALWLAGRPLWLELPSVNALVVHAGLLPGVELARQPRHLLLNLRSFEKDGTPTTRADRGTPWASMWPGPKWVLFGHDALRGLQRHPHAVGLDTGCVYGGKLSGAWFPEMEVVSVPAQRMWSQPESL